MADATEICEVRWNGQKFTDWTTVEVKRAFGVAATEFRLTVAEISDPGGNYPDLKLKAGDKIEIWLAGFKVVDGKIYIRQAGMTPRNRMILLTGASRTHELVISSHMARGGQYKGYTFEQIANAALKPYGIKFRWGKNKPKDADTPFKDPQTFPGESPWELLERLARSRGITLHDDKDGNLVGSAMGSPGAGAQFVEGDNILSINVTEDDLSARSYIGGLAQQQGSDQLYGTKAAQVKAEATNPAMTDYRPLLIVSEEPASKEDLQKRVDREAEVRAWTTIRVSVTVQGWLNREGRLYDVYDDASVFSPSTIPSNGGRADLVVQGVAFSQEASGGTTTMLELVRNPQGRIGGLAPQGEGPNLFNSKPDPAKPVEPEGAPT